MHFGHIFAIRFADCQHRLTRSELTANIKNIQISAEICKEQTQIKNADTKTLIDNLQFAECNQLHQSPSSKYGGGGARAAWRIRILECWLKTLLVASTTPKVKAVKGDCKFAGLANFYWRFLIILIDKHRIHKFPLIFLCLDCNVVIPKEKLRFSCTYNVLVQEEEEF